MIGQVLREHGNDAIREVHGRGPRTRFAIDRTANAHIVADVSNGDDEPPTAALRFGVHGIIEILGIRAIDGDQRQFTQILAALMIGGQSHLGKTGSRRQEPQAEIPAAGHA